MSAPQGLAEKLTDIADFLALDGTPERQQEANDLTDAARRLHELEREVARLREAIEDAPHNSFCGAPSSSGSQVFKCRCWKASALEGKP